MGQNPAVSVLTFFTCGCILIYLIMRNTRFKFLTYGTVPDDSSGTGPHNPQQGE